MKLIVQIPCYNEESTLAATVTDLPPKIEGIEEIELLVVDDGSTDDTVEVAREIGVHHIIRNKTNMGLARTFRVALDASLERGADVIVNTDGDNQYAGSDISRLIRPILDGTADIVVGDRQTRKLAHFSLGKRLLQRLGSVVVHTFSDIDVPDPVSGFRAISRDAALHMNIVSPFSYTTEMLIQAGKKDLVVASVPVSVNEKTRESRLFSGFPNFIQRQVSTILRVYAMYQPLRTFFLLGLFMSLVGLIPIARFLWIHIFSGGGGHLQSLVLGGVLLLMGVLCFLFAMIADLINFNRQLVEQTLYRVRRLELELKRKLDS